MNRGAFGLPFFFMNDADRTPSTAGTGPAGTGPAGIGPLDQRPPIDAAWLERMRAGKPAFLRSLFEMFLAEEPKRVCMLSQAVTSQDMEQVRFVAHSLKGAAATMGMERLRDACRELEFAAKSGGSGGMAGCMEKIERETEAVFAVMRQVLAQA